MKHLSVLLAALALLGCEVPSFGFETEAVPCSVPEKVSEATTEAPNANGCWRVTAEPGHGFTHDDPGLVTCSLGDKCIIVVPGEAFWSLGQGYTKSTVEDVDCSEVCQ